MNRESFKRNMTYELISIYNRDIHLESFKLNMMCYNKSRIWPGLNMQRVWQDVWYDSIRAFGMMACRVCHPRHVAAQAT